MCDVSKENSFLSHKIRSRLFKAGIEDCLKKVAVIIPFLYLYPPKLTLDLAMCLSLVNVFTKCDTET